MAKCRANAKRWKRSQAPGGGFKYKIGDNSIEGFRNESWALTAAGITTLIGLAEWDRKEALDRAFDYLQRKGRPRFEGDDRIEGDRYLLTQGELESRIEVLLAGTVTEELVFDDVSTGAQNDLERATEIARSMVMDYGMSRLGRVTFRESSRSAFLSNGSGDFPRERSHSEQTAREIDEEVKHIIDGSIVKVRHIIEGRRPALEALAQRLIEKEVIDADELKQIGLKPEDVPKMRLWKGRGCPHCLNSGYLDRTAIYEIFTVNDTVRDQIMVKAGSTQMKSDALKRGMRTLRMDGARKVLKGQTTVEEVLRVTQMDTF